MKKIFISLISFALLFSSCEEWIDPSINDDPNNPADVDMPQLVAPIEVNLAYIVGGEMARWECVWMQQIAGLQSQAAENDIYILGESDVTNAWSYNLYSPGMINTKILMEKAVTKKSPHYSAIAKILMAYQLGVTTDNFGDIPYSDAFKGLKYEFKSKYDTQESIYSTIFTLLDEAITEVDATSSLFSPGSEDVIYGGSMKMWKRTAYALKARYSIHLSKLKGAVAYNDALIAVAEAYKSNDDDLKVGFYEDYTNSNPIYQSEQERKGYYGANTTYLNLLNATSDPRLGVYFKGNVGSNPGQGYSKASKIGAQYASATSSIYLMSYVEIKFIEAEASFATNNIARAVAAYNEGLKASLEREGVFDAAWYNANMESETTITLEKIMTQKYLSSFMQIESWTDWRRTGFPALVKAEGAVTNEIPRRLPYPDEERLYNGENTPTGVSITDRVWWDVK